MPKIDISKAQGADDQRLSARVPQGGRGARENGLGDAAGLTQFGVNLTRLKPGARIGAAPLAREEDEFVYMLEGELVLVEDGGETVLKPGDCRRLEGGHRASAISLSIAPSRDAVYIEVGTRAPRERAHYPGLDLMFERDESGVRVHP